MSQSSQCGPDGVREMSEAIPGQPVIIFSGQGAQDAGMGRDVAEADADAMLLWKEAEKASGLPLREIYWDGGEADMADTRALQPALTAVNLSLWQALEKRLPLPLACAGHSLGEFAALACAGVISPKSAIELTALRGRLMAEADPGREGAMAAIVKLEAPLVESLVAAAAAESGRIIVAANYNTPTQTVISGSAQAVEAACQKAKELKGRALMLKVSGAFHSPMMEEANRELAPLLEKIQWRDAAFPVYCGVDAKGSKSGADLKKNMLRQMISPVFWVDLARNLYLAGARWWVEISPRAVLGKMLGPSMAGLAGYCDNLRVDLVSSLSSVIKLPL